METTTVTISLPKDVGNILEKRAEDSGQDFETYIKNIVETQAKKMTLDETLAPFLTKIYLTNWLIICLTFFPNLLTLETSE